MYRGTVSYSLQSTPSFHLLPVEEESQRRRRVLQKVGEWCTTTVSHILLGVVYLIPKPLVHRRLAFEGSE